MRDRPVAPREKRLSRPILPRSAPCTGNSGSRNDPVREQPRFDPRRYATVEARNATTGEPQKVFIVLDTRLSRKAARYYDMNETEQERLKDELDGRGATFFEGDDTDPDATSVQAAYADALDALEEHGIVDWADRTLDYAETFEALHKLEDFPDAQA